jgi:hypothetical protein
VIGQVDSGADRGGAARRRPFRAALLAGTAAGPHGPARVGRRVAEGALGEAERELDQGQLAEAGPQRAAQRPVAGKAVQAGQQLTGSGEDVVQAEAAARGEPGAGLAGAAGGVRSSPISLTGSPPARSRSTAVAASWPATDRLTRCQAANSAASTPRKASSRDPAARATASVATAVMTRPPRAGRSCCAMEPM